MTHHEHLFWDKVYQKNRPNLSKQSREIYLKKKHAMNAVENEFLQSHFYSQRLV